MRRYNKILSIILIVLLLGTTINISVFAENEEITNDEIIEDTNQYIDILVNSQKAKLRVLENTKDKDYDVIKLIKQYIGERKIYYGYDFIYSEKSNVYNIIIDNINIEKDFELLKININFENDNVKIESVDFEYNNKSLSFSINNFSYILLVEKVEETKIDTSEVENSNTLEEENKEDENTQVESIEDKQPENENIEKPVENENTEKENSEETKPIEDEIIEVESTEEKNEEEVKSEEEKVEEKEEELNVKTISDNNVSLTGLMPTNAEIQVKDLNKDTKNNRNTKSNTIVIAEYDISIIVDGKEYQPDKENPIYVEITCDQLENNSVISLQHIKDDDTVEEITHFSINDKTICFEAYGFSVYKVVMAPEPITDGYIDLTFSDDITAYPIYVDVNGYYFTNEWWIKSGRNLIKKTSVNQINSAAQYHFERINDQYYAYTVIDNINYYIVLQYVDNDRGGLSLSSNIEDATKFNVEKWNNSDSYFQVYGYVNGRKYYWNMQGGNSGNGFAAYKTQNDINGKLRFCYYDEIESDVYDLNEKSYGLVYALSSINGMSISSEEKISSNKHYLAGQAVLYRADSLNGSNSLYVANDSNITMWTFHSVRKDIYYLSTIIDGVEKYMSITANNDCLLVDTPDETCELQIIPGDYSSSNAGKIQLKRPNHSLAYSGSYTGFVGSGTGIWINFVELSDIYSEEDFVNYSAKKISVSDIQNGDEVIIYTRIWNNRTSEYEFYLINQDGKLLRGYESGDDIVWINTKINTVSWKFYEYYYVGTSNPNYYYDLQNTYSEKYIAPQLNNNTITVDNPFGINLNGRRYGDYYSTIIAWDDPHYDYAGLIEDNGSVKPAPMAQATQFSFAIMKRPDELHEVETVDHEIAGVTLKVIDFDGNSFQNECLGGSTTTQGTKSLQGLLSTNLNASGYPDCVLTNHSLSELFSTSSTKVNHLFLQSSYKNSGYYEFDSTQNFASLDGTNFKVYQELGTVDYVHGNTIKHGQFMPFNDLTPGSFCTINPENLYDALGNELSDNNPRKGEKLYKIPASDSDSPNAANFYFGMELTSDFVQPLGGKDAWGHDIIFEFTGDDDFWLYVDGELVLDLGGIHSAIPGTINFSTGVVVYRNSSGKNITTSIYDIFRSNYEARGLSNSEIEANLADIFILKNINGTNRYVFKDYSVHSMKMFYMERGAGASNLKMRFNLSAIKPNQVQLSKEIDGTEKQDYVSAKFPFQIYYSDGTNEHILYPDNNSTNPISVKYLNTNIDVEYLQSYNHDGQNYDHVFFLKPEETAVINFPSNITQYWIKECAVKTNIYNTTTINNEQPYATITNIDTVDYISSRESIKNRSKVIFKNYVDQSNLRTLSITKRLFDESGNQLTTNQDNTTFRFRLYLGENLDYYRLGDYYIKDPNGYYCSYEAGVGFVSSGIQSISNMTPAQKQACTFYTSPSGAIDKIPANYTIEIRDLLVDTKFKVTEDSYEIPLGYGMRTWTETVGGVTTTYTGYKRVEGSYIVEPGMGQNEGIIRDNNDPQIEIHNQRGFGIRVNKVWSDSSFILSHGDIYIAIFIDNSNTPIPGTVRKIDSYNYTTYYFSTLEPNCTLNNYHVYEVKLTDISIDANNNITYSSIEKLGVVDPNEAFTVSNNTKIDGTNAGDLVYTVSYSPGELTGTVDNIYNTRIDTVKNNRLGGLTIKKTSMNTSEFLSNAVFKLEDSDSIIGTYTSDNTGTVTNLYLEDGTYYLTELQAPNGYQRLTTTFTITVQSGQFSVTGFNNENAEYNSETSILVIKNKPIKFNIIKISAVDNSVLENAHFALYKEFQGIKSYYPLDGFEDLVSDENGIISLIDELIASGTYYLTEIQAPNGYRLLDKDIRFTKYSYGNISIDTSYEGTLVETDNNGIITYTINVTNNLDIKTPVLPGTGSITGIILSLIGFIIIIAGIFIITKRKVY